MPALIRPGTVKVLTQDGEVHVLITLELNINLNNGNGLVENITEEIKSVEIKAEKEINPVEAVDTEWMIPDFGSTQKIKFGNKD